MVEKRLTHRDLIDFLARVPNDGAFRVRLLSSPGTVLTTDGFASDGQAGSLLEALCTRGSAGGASSLAKHEGRDGIDFARDM